MAFSAISHKVAAFCLLHAASLYLHDLRFRTFFYYDRNKERFLSFVGMDKEKFLSAVSPQRCFHTPSAFFHKIPMRMACKKYPVSSKSGIRPDSKKHYPIHPYLEPKSDTVRVPSFAKCIDQHLS